MMIGRKWEYSDDRWRLCRVNGASVVSLIEVVRDETYPTMWRIHEDNGNVSDLLNLTRAKDAAATWAQVKRSKPLAKPLDRVSRRAAGRTAGKAVKATARAVADAPPYHDSQPTTASVCCPVSPRSLGQRNDRRAL